MNWTSSSLAEAIAELRVRQGNSIDTEVKAAREEVPKGVRTTRYRRSEPAEVSKD